MVAQLATNVKTQVPHPVNDAVAQRGYLLCMAKDVTEIYRGRQVARPHHIEDWAEARDLQQKDIVRELGVDKSLVSRWYAGSTPSKEWQEKLADFFGIEREALFRHPNDDWVTRFFADRSNDEIARMKTMLEAAFPKKRA